MKDNEKAEVLLIMLLYVPQHCQHLKMFSSLLFDLIFLITPKGEAIIIPIEQTRKLRLQDKDVTQICPGQHTAPCVTAMYQANL